jgi:predicted nucleic acid-binding protein
MTALVFVDTNVLIYSVDLADPNKQETAQYWMSELWKNRNGRISFQVLQEFYAKVSRKQPAAREKTRTEIHGLLAWRPVPINANILDHSLKIQDRYGLSFWDALIVAAAKSVSCRYLLTEDLQSSQDFDGLLVVNPFATDPKSLN